MAKATIHQVVPYKKVGRVKINVNLDICVACGRNIGREGCGSKFSARPLA